MGGDVAIVNKKTGKTACYKLNMLNNGQAQLKEDFGASKTMTEHCQKVIKGNNAIEARAEEAQKVDKEGFEKK